MDLYFYNNSVSVTLTGLFIFKRSIHK